MCAYRTLVLPKRYPRRTPPVPHAGVKLLYKGIMSNPNTLIKVAAVRKTYTTIGEVRYLCCFQACEGNYTVDNIQSAHKTEESATRKLESLKAKHGHRFAPSYVVVPS